MAGYTKNSNGTYSVNYNDERFKNVEAEKNQKLQESTNMYDQMIQSSDKFYEDQINASKEWADKQSEIQQKKTDFLVEQTEQQKEKAERDYTKEQKGAYTDYMKQSNDYGVKAEQLAANGLANSGYSESSRVSMWNTYQNRYATAREGFNQAVLNYNNSIKEALLANDEALAQITYQALQQQLELSLQGFQYKNTLLQTKQQELNQINENYYNRYQNVLAQINQEIQYQMETDKFIEQHNQWMKEFKAESEQREREWAQKQKEWALQEKQLNAELANTLAEGRLLEAQYNATKKSYSSGGSSVSYSVNSGNVSTNSGNTSKKNSTPTLSEAARKIYESASGPFGILQRPFLKKNIEDMYKDGKISDYDAEWLFNQLGL